MNKYLYFSVIFFISRILFIENIFYKIYMYSVKYSEICYISIII